MRLSDLLLPLFLLLIAPSAEGGDFYYTYGETDGGLGKLSIDATAQHFEQSKISPATLQSPKRIRLSADGRHGIVGSEDSPKIWVLHLDTHPIAMVELTVEGKTSKLEVQGDHALVASSKGWFYWINLPNGTIEHSWNARSGLTPPGRKGEEICFLPQQKQALITFQKDDKTGTDKGSRLLVFDLEKFSPLHDILLPRDHANLHLPASLKEQGPNPELIFVSPRTNTLILSLDLYGALATFDLHAALQGQLLNLKYTPTSLSSDWGTSFPDRGALFKAGEKDYLLISNAAQQGGLALFDVADRRVLQTFPASAGAEAPLYLAHSQQLVTVISGKLKSRGSKGLEKIYQPGNKLLVFGTSELAAGGKMSFEEITFPFPVSRLDALDPSASSLLLLLSEAPGHPEWLIYDLANRTITRREPAPAAISRIAAWRGASPAK